MANRASIPLLLSYQSCKRTVGHGLPRLIVLRSSVKVVERFKLKVGSTNDGHVLFVDNAYGHLVNFLSLRLTVLYQDHNNMLNVRALNNLLSENADQKLFLRWL